MKMNSNLSPIAAASRDLIVLLAKGADPSEVEAECRVLLQQNTNGLGSEDTLAVEVAGEVIRGILTGVVLLRSSTIESATRGLTDTGEPGPAGDAERLSISERTCRDVRDSDGASRTDYDSALKGASTAAKLTSDQLRQRIEENSPEAQSGHQKPNPAGEAG